MGQAKNRGTYEQRKESKMKELRKENKMKVVGILILGILPYLLSKFTTYSLYNFLH